MDLEKLIKAIKSASKPLILVGRGIRAGGCKSIFDKFLKNNFFKEKEERNYNLLTTILSFSIIYHTKIFHIFE